MQVSQREIIKPHENTVLQHDIQIQQPHLKHRARLLEIRENQAFLKALHPREEDIKFWQRSWQLAEWNHALPASVQPTAVGNEECQNTQKQESMHTHQRSKAPGGHPVLRWMIAVAPEERQEGEVLDNTEDGPILRSHLQLQLSPSLLHHCGKLSQTFRNSFTRTQSLLLLLHSTKGVSFTS